MTSSTLILLELFGAVALVLWGIQTVSTGVQRAFGARLRQLLGAGLKSRARAFFAGLLVTTLLQSSTATALMVSSFTADGLVRTAPGLAVMLGANVGTALIVQLLSFHAVAIWPVLVLVGVWAHRQSNRSITRDLGSAAVGLGLLLLALHTLVQVMRPVEDSGALRNLLGAITQDMLLNAVIAGLFSWAAHSSVAAVLLVMSLAAAGVISPSASMAMVIGANVGSAINPLIESLGHERARLRLPVGNLANRLLGAVLLLPFLPDLAAPLASNSPDRTAANFHLAFNLGTAAAFMGALPWIARLLERLFPEQAKVSEPGTPKYLDEAALTTPSVALSNSSREVLRMANVVEAMLRGSQDAFEKPDRDRIRETSKLDDALDRLYGGVQRYLGAISSEHLSEAEARRISEILAAAINLEHAGDIIDKNLMGLAEKALHAAIKLTPGMVGDVRDCHSKLLDHLRLGVTVFMSGDVEAARRLVTEKEAFRDIERLATEQHVQCMRGGRAADIEVSAFLLDIIRDLKRIEAHIASIGHGLLEQHGHLRSSRLQ